MSRQALIIGSSGLVAPALARHLRDEGWRVRHAGRGGGADIRFDLAKPDLAVLPSDVDALFLIAAETSLKRCEEEPEATHAVNVAGPVAIAEAYAVQGAHVLMLSTNLVFDGTAAMMPATAPPRPACVYGRQKAELESALLALPIPGTILRITKIVESLETLTAGWHADLHAGRVIRPFSDLVCAPVRLARILDILAFAAAHRTGGIFQHGGDRDIDYAGIARILCRAIKAPETLIEPMRGADLAQPPVALPRHTTLAETLPSGLGSAESENVTAVLDGFFTQR